MVLAAVVAFVLNVGLLRSRDDVVLVAMANRDLVPGEELDASALDLVEIDAGEEVLAQLVESEDIAGVEGRIVTRSVRAGELIDRSALREAAAPADLRAISIPVDPEHAVGGTLIERGDLVDVIAVDDGTARYVVTGAEVLSVADRDQRGLAGAGAFFVVVAVDADSALAIAEALAADSVELVRATGAPAPARVTLEPDPPPPSTVPG